MYVKPKPRKEQILETAAYLFRKKGYNATSVRMIASELGIEAASLYNHIASKQEILRELLFQMAGVFTQEMEKIETSGKNPFQQMEDLVMLHVQLTLQNPDQISLITGEWVHLEEPAHQQYVQLRQEYELRFKAIIKAGMDSGYLERADVDVALFSILSTLHWLYSWVARHKNVSSEILGEQMKQTLLLGLKKR